jgi:aconitate hydratase
MINGIGVVGWGVGGIEAEAGMLGQPVYFLTPDVVGVNLTGALREGCTATDLVLTITELLRKEKVVGKFVEFFGEGTESLTLTDRATIANMAPEYGATMGFFPVDEATLDYFRGTGRSNAEVAAFEAYFRAQNLFGVPRSGEIDYTTVVALDLGSVAPSLAGPKRPQDRIEIGNVKHTFADLFSKPTSQNGFNKRAEDLNVVYQNADGVNVRNGDVLIAAITSCTNTSNPSVLLAAGLLCKKAVEAGLQVSPHIKTSLAPGSRVVTKYLEAAGLLPYMEKLGFGVTAYGCTTCIGNAGDLTPAMNEAIVKNDIVASAVLSGNRNFEARIHPNIRSNFLASPPLVVAYAIAGNMNVDLMKEPVGVANGREIFLGDIWPTSAEIQKLMKFAMNAKTFKENYADVKGAPGKLWQQIKGVASGEVYNWPTSTYIAEPPFFDDFTMEPKAAATGIQGARALGVFGDSITTDHISPAGSIKETSPAGQWLLANGVQRADFNSYGSRRGNHEVMIRGTFANVRLRNQLAPGTEGGFTRDFTQHDAPVSTIFEASSAYIKAGIPLVILAGKEYGSGSSRDWAAKGTVLLGVRAVIAESYERIHRSNLIGMGVLPLQFLDGQNATSLGLTGAEVFDIKGVEELNSGKIPEKITVRAGKVEFSVSVRIDTDSEAAYYRHGGIMQYALRNLLD